MKKTFTIKYFLLLLYLINTPVFPQTFNTKIYTPDNGLPDPMVFDVVQDREGIMWFATRSGICSYDGIEWRKYGKDEGIDEIWFNKLQLDEEGILWAMPFSLQYPVFFFKNERWEKINIDIPLPIIVNSKYFIIKNSKIFIGLGDWGLLYYNEKKWMHFNVENSPLPDNDVNSVILFRNEIYIGTDKGLIKFDIQKDAFFYPDKLNKLLPSSCITAFCIDSLSQIDKLLIYGDSWLGEIEDSFKIINSSVHKPVDFYTHSFLKKTTTNNIYFGNEGMLFVLNEKDNQIKYLGRKNNFITEGATSIYEDYEKNIWVTTFRGVTKIISSPFNNYFNQNGLFENEVTAISQFNNGLFVLGHNKGITFMGENEFSYYSLISDEKFSHLESRVLGIQKDNENNIWFVSVTNGLGKINQDKSVRFFKMNNDLRYYSLLILQDNSIIVGTNRGAYLFKNGKFSSKPDFSFSKEKMIRRIYQLRNGDLIFSTSEGLILYNGSIKKINNNDPLGSDRTFSIYETKDSKILLGTTAGLYELKEGKIRKFKQNYFAINSPVYFIIEDSDGNFWFGLDNGVIKWNGKSYKHYSKKEGLAGNETNRAAAFVDREDNLWIGTDGGLSLYNKDYLSNIEVVPKLKLLNFETSKGEVFSSFSKNILEPYQDNLIFHFRGLSFIDESAEEYHVQLSKLNDSWKDEYITMEPFARFSNLDAGDYIFTVKYKNARGIFSLPVQSSIINIKTPFYNEIWFYILSLFAVAMVIYTVQDYYNQRKYSNELKVQVKERTLQLEQSETTLKELNTELENKVKEKTIELSSLIEQSPYGIAIFDTEGLLMESNKVLRDFLNDNGIDQTRMNLFASTSIIPEDYINLLSQIKYSGGVLLTMPFSHKNKIGIEKWYVFRFYSVSHFSKKVDRVVCFVEDVTEQKKIEDVTNQLYEQKVRSAAVLDAIENERKRISRDLHDELGQILTGAKLKLEVFEHNSQTYNEHINSALYLLSKAGFEIRNIIHDLHPMEIDSYGLYSSIELLCDRLKKNTSIKVEYYNSNTLFPLGKEEQLYLYRIMQEAINNILKHSNSTKVYIKFEGDEKKLIIKIADNGIGFNFNHQLLYKSEGKSYGLINMFERCELLNGTLKINSSPGSGTEIIICIPSKLV